MVRNLTVLTVNCKQKLYLYSTKLFESELFKIELFICIKMDLAFINLQWLICHKTQPTIPVHKQIPNRTTSAR